MFYRRLFSDNALRFVINGTRLAFPAPVGSETPPSRRVAGRRRVGADTKVRLHKLRGRSATSWCKRSAGFGGPFALLEPEGALEQGHLPQVIRVVLGDPVQRDVVRDPAPRVARPA